MRGVALVVVLLGVPALAACGSADEGPRVQRVAFCPGPSDYDADDRNVVVEFKQGSTVVATGSVTFGGVVSAEVPVGAIEIWADGVKVGSVNEGVPTDGPYTPPGPDDVTYLSSPDAGCPERVPS